MWHWLFSKWNEGFYSHINSTSLSMCTLSKYELGYSEASINWGGDSSSKPPPLPSVSKASIGYLFYQISDFFPRVFFLDFWRKRQWYLARCPWLTPKGVKGQDIFWGQLLCLWFRGTLVAQSSRHKWLKGFPVPKVTDTTQWEIPALLNSFLTWCSETKHRHKITRQRIAAVLFAAFSWLSPPGAKGEDSVTCLRTQALSLGSLGSNFTHCQLYDSEQVN